MNITEALKTDLCFLKTSGGDIGTISGLPNLQRALYRRLLTIPGTLVYNPQYGIGLGLYENAPNSFGMQQQLASKIIDQFPQDPRVQSVSSVSVQSDDESPELVKVAVTMIPVGYTELTMVFTALSGANS